MFFNRSRSRNKLAHSLHSFIRFVTGAVQSKLRELQLEPNTDTDTKIEWYPFQFSKEITLGTPETFTIVDTPSSYIRARKLKSNAPTENFMMLRQASVGNINALLGGNMKGAEESEMDAFHKDSSGHDVDLPTLAPGIPATIRARYTGIVPSGHATGEKFTATFVLHGPASMTA
jgi:hypothetical protein